MAHGSVVVRVGARNNVVARRGELVSPAPRG